MLKLAFCDTSESIFRGKCYITLNVGVFKPFIQYKPKINLFINYKQ